MACMLSCVKGVRSSAAALAMLATLVGPGCVPEPVPDKCSGRPASLGLVDELIDISDDGDRVLIMQYPALPGPREYYVVDRREGTRRLLTTYGAGDGLRLWMDARGERVLQFRYPERDRPTNSWSIVDVATGVVTPLLIDGGAWNVQDVASDLSALMLVRYDTSFRQADIRTVSLVDGTTTVSGIVLGENEWLRSVSPSLRTAFVRTHGSNPYSVRAVDVASGATLFGPFSVAGEGMFSDTFAPFVDETTVLMDNARPASEAPGAVTADDAFLLNIATGATRRLDPGGLKVGVVAASASGARRLALSWSPEGLWLYMPDADPRRVRGTSVFVATPDLDVVVTMEGREAFVTCA